MHELIATPGQFFDLLEIFRLNGFPSETHSYLFNGDFVDRGSWSTEVALTLYAYKMLYPKLFFLNRGNHETDDMNRMYGFEGECRAKYTERVFKIFSESFSALPLATLIGKKFFVLHGGLFSKDEISLDDVRKLNRHKQRQPGQSGLMMEMLWTDPQPTPGRGPSKRGVGMQFGPDVTKRFCEKNGLEAVIRSHEVRMEGYEVEHDGKCITGTYSDFQTSRMAKLTRRQSSLLGSQVLRQHGKQGCIHQHWSRVQARVPQVRGGASPADQADGIRLQRPYVDDVDALLIATNNASFLQSMSLTSRGRVYMCCSIPLARFFRSRFQKLIFRLGFASTSCGQKGSKENWLGVCLIICLRI